MQWLAVAALLAATVALTVAIVAALRAGDEAAAAPPQAEMAMAGHGAMALPSSMAESREAAIACFPERACGKTAAL
jgi:hypothetical protein